MAGSKRRRAEQEQVKHEAGKKVATRSTKTVQIIRSDMPVALQQTAMKIMKQAAYECNASNWMTRGFAENVASRFAAKVRLGH